MVADMIDGAVSDAGRLVPSDRSGAASAFTPSTITAPTAAAERKKAPRRTLGLAVGLSSLAAGGGGSPVMVETVHSNGVNK